MPTRHARTIPAVLLIVAGALTAIGAFVAGIPMPSGNWYLWTFFVADLALAVAFFLLARTFTHRWGRTALYLSGAGWAIYGLAGLSTGIGFIASIGGIIALVFGIVSAIIVYRQRFFTPRASTMFIAAEIAGAIYLVYPASFFTVVFGAALLVTGIFMQRRR